VLTCIAICPVIPISCIKKVLTPVLRNRHVLTSLAGYFLKLNDLDTSEYNDKTCTDMS
jgi:hypothetical protein